MYALDSFDRNLAEGWGAADRGGAWSLAGSAWSFAANGAGSITASAGRGPAAYLNGVSSTDTDVRVSVGTDKPAVNTSIFLSVVGRRVSGGGDYRAKVRLLANGAVGVSIGRTAADGKESLVTPEVMLPDVTYSADTSLRVRFQVVGTGPTTTRVKVWPVTATEPAMWLLSATDSTGPLQVAGGVGLMHYLGSTAANAPVAALFDDFAAGPSS